MHTNASPRALSSAARLALTSFAILVAAASGVAGRGPSHRAHLSDDLLRHEVRHSSARTRVIAHGSTEEIAALAARHRLDVVRWLADGAVLRANSSEIAALAADTAVEHLSGDPLVAPSMSISNASMSADKTRAGSGGLLGIGAIPAVTGQGIVAAVVDSGIASHPALAKKVIANVSFVTGDPSADDAYGHGTHVAGIITGSAGPASQVTGLYTGGVAPGVQLVNVRVLGGQGSGYTSDVI